VELAHEVAQESRRRVVGDLTIGSEDLRCVTDVGLWRGHLTGVAEAEDTAQALLTDRGTDRSYGCPNDGGYVVEGVLTPGPRRPVDGIFQCAGDGLVVLGRDEEDRVGPVDRFLQCCRLRRVVAVIVRAVQRQVADEYLAEFQIVRGYADQGFGQDAVDGLRREAPDEVADL
jgi:hypothetical protein